MADVLKPLDYAAPKTPPRAGKGAAVAWAIAGLVPGLGCVWLAIGLGGFGHG
jgi:hypothetical protein